MKVTPFAKDSAIRMAYARKIFLPLALLLMLSLTACLSLFGGDDEGAPETVDPAAGTEGEAETVGQLFGDEVVIPPGIGYLTCTDACSDFAQCGVTPELGTVVLLNTQGPAGKVHDWAITNSTEIDILGATEELVYPAAGNPYTARYYNVTVRDRGQAWVAGWCVTSLP